MWHHSLVSDCSQLHTLTKWIKHPSLIPFLGSSFVPFTARNKRKRDHSWLPSLLLFCPLHEKWTNTDGQKRSMRHCSTPDAAPAFLFLAQLQNEQRKEKCDPWGKKAAESPFLELVYRYPHGHKTALTPPSAYEHTPTHVHHTHKTIHCLWVSMVLPFVLDDLLEAVANGAVPVSTSGSDLKLEAGLDD